MVSMQDGRDMLRSRGTSVKVRVFLCSMVRLLRLFLFVRRQARNKIVKVLFIHYSYYPRFDIGWIRFFNCSSLYVHGDHQ